MRCANMSCWRLDAEHGSPTTGCLLPSEYDHHRLGPTAPTFPGMAFAFGWTPYVGPILAAILFDAGASQTMAQGALLLLVYSLGMAVPFVATGVGFSQMVGVLFLTSQFFWVSIAMQRLYDTIFYR